MYEFKIKPYIGTSQTYEEKSFTFEGEVKMHLTCNIPTKQIIFHGVGLNVDTNSLLLESVDDITVDRNIKYDSVREYFIVDMNKECKRDLSYSLSFKFSGIIDTVLLGFYRSSYTNTKGEKV